ncbi:MAG TPA: sigma factor-like helix-turn-helix DNA-binding protein [Polyangiaceae bacterium]
MGYSGKVPSGYPPASAPSASPLATIFAAAREGTEATEELEQHLVHALSRAREAWPALAAAVQDAAFVRYVAERVAPERLEGAFAEDLYLACACACAEGNARALAVEAFDRLHLAPLTRALEAGGVDRFVAEEVVQLLRARLFVGASGERAKIGEYAGRAPIGGWLHVAAVRMASKLRRAETTRAQAARNAAPAAGLPGVDPELATIQRRYGDLSKQTFHEAFGALSAEERSVLRLYFVDGLNIERIGVVLGLSRATVGRRMVAARERLLEETLRLLGARLQATPAEVLSLLGILRSHLEVSFGALLSERQAG